MLQRNRRKTLVIGVALAVAALLAACNPTNETVTTNINEATTSTRLYWYTGDAPAWLQVRVASSGSTRVEVSGETQQRTGAQYCIGDGAYGVDVFATCRLVQGGIQSPFRAAQTDGVSRGWKKLMAIPGKTRFIIHVTSTGGPADHAAMLEFSVVDGNGNPVGDIAVSEGIG